MKIAVLGSSGMAGHMITRILKKEGFNVSNYARDKVFEDTEHLDLDTICGVLFAERPDYIINCVGILVQDSEKSLEKAIKINGIFPNRLGFLANRINAKLAHLSTDCVFSGETYSYYHEDSIPDSKTNYGLSKLVGELVHRDGLVIRTSIIGPEIQNRKQKGLHDWFLNKKGYVKGYTETFWSGVTTYELAKYILWLIKSDEVFKGIIHLTNNKAISKSDLLRLIDPGRTIIENDTIKINKWLKSKYQSEYKVPGYKKMIREMKDNYVLA